MNNDKQKPKKVRWYNKKLLLKIASVLVAAVCWILVAMNGKGTDYSETIEHVPVNVDLQTDIFNQLELSIIEVSTDEVSVQVRGDRVAISQLQPYNLMATVQVPGTLTEPGTYELTVISAPAGSNVNLLSSQYNAYEVVAYEPEKISVKVDRIVTESFPVESVITGLSVADGFIQEKDPVVTVNQVNVTGPQTEVSKVASCIVQTSLDSPLQGSYKEMLDIVLLDDAGNQIDPAEQHLELDHDNAQLEISVLKTVNVPLRIGLMGVPSHVPEAEIQYVMSNAEVYIAGPVENVENLSELMLGYVNLKDISKRSNIFYFDVELPSGFITLDNIRTVTITFSSDEWEEADFVVDDIRTINDPVRYDVTLVTQMITGVKMVGDADIMLELTSDDIVAELDLSERDLTPGQYQYPVKISVPSRGLVWASGDHNVVIQVTEKTPSDPEAETDN